MNDSQPSTCVKTRFLIISDTHGKENRPDKVPSQHADVAIHCGDLTQRSQLHEYEATIELLKRLQAPLKLVISGNHDFTLDTPTYKEILADAEKPLDPAHVRDVYGDFGEARHMLDDLKAAGIVFLDEGNHQFTLQNGAILTVYASPFTPSYGSRAFQYPLAKGHTFEIGKGVDLAITHGPPCGILDLNPSNVSSGSSHLFEAVARARPRLHCFGHIHEGWGARMVTWRDSPTETPSHSTDIDNERSFVIETLRGLRASKSDTLECTEQKSKKVAQYLRQRCCTTSHCAEDAHPLRYGAQTLFVNAALRGPREHPQQLPWLVELELPKAA